MCGVNTTVHYDLQLFSWLYQSHQNLDTLYNLNKYLVQMIHVFEYMLSNTWCPDTYCPKYILSDTYSPNTFCPIPKVRYIKYDTCCPDTYCHRYILSDTYYPDTYCPRP